jgi:uncharacterized protein YvpB
MKFHLGFSYLVLIIISCVLTYACSEIAPETEDHQSASKTYGASTHVFYSCQTATQTPEGAFWLYETPEIMNLMDSIDLEVSKDSESFGVSKLSKVDTDTFSDGNLTVFLQQVGHKKSIAVEHRTMGLFARADNGWCSSEVKNQTQELIENDRNFDQFQLQIDSNCENPCTWYVKTNLSIASVVYEADDWFLTENRDAQNQFEASYKFEVTGQRKLKAIAFDSYGQLIASDYKIITILSISTQNQDTQENQPHQENDLNQPQANQQGAIEVPYYYQYNNTLHPGASCQNTSVAMILNYLGVQISPDSITREFGKETAKSVSGLNYVFNTLASRYGVNKIDSHANASLAMLRASLDRGQPVITHGYFTRGGHVVVVTGYDTNGYYVNDPAGTWVQSFMASNAYPNRYNEPYAGRNIYYSKVAFETAIASLDGYTLGSIWLHVLK